MLKDRASGNEREVIIDGTWPERGLQQMIPVDDGRVRFGQEEEQYFLWERKEGIKVGI